MFGQHRLDLLLDLYQKSRNMGEWASLSLETKDGKEFVSFKMGNNPAGSSAGFRMPFLSPGMRRKTPSQRRRDERRKSEFLTTKSVVSTDRLLDDQSVVKKEESEAKINGSYCCDDAFEDTSVNPEYELLIDAHTTCTSEDVKEAIEENFWGTLDEENVEKEDQIRKIIVQITDKQTTQKVGNESRKVEVFKVTVNENQLARATIEGWKEPYKFDPLAFKKSDLKNIRIEVRDVQKLT